MLVINKIPFNLVVVSLRLKFAKRSTCIIVAPYRFRARSIEHLVTFCIILDCELVKLALLVLREVGG
jgi:hypothetical protein